MMTAKTPFAFSAREKALLRKQHLMLPAPSDRLNLKEFDDRILRYLLEHATVADEAELKASGISVPALTRQVGALSVDDGFRPDAVLEIQKAIKGRLGTTRSGQVQKELDETNLWLIRAESGTETPDGYYPTRIYAVTKDVTLIMTHEAGPREDNLVVKIGSNQLTNQMLARRVPEIRGHLIGRARARLAAEQRQLQAYERELVNGMSRKELEAVETQASTVFAAENDAAEAAEKAARKKAEEEAAAAETSAA
jgi:hypothetical protein